MTKFAKQKGKFWLPKSPEHKVDGEFELVDEALGILTVYDVIDSSVNYAVYINEADERMQHPLIIGQLNNNEYVALLESSFHFLHIKGDKKIFGYYINVTVFNTPFLINSENELEFKKISFSYDNLTQYLGYPNVEHDFNKESLSVSNKFTTYENSFILSNELLCKIIYTFDSSFSLTQKTSFISPITIIDLESSSEKNIFQWLKLIDNNIGSFFSFWLENIYALL